MDWGDGMKDYQESFYLGSLRHYEQTSALYDRLHKIGLEDESLFQYNRECEITWCDETKRAGIKPVRTDWRMTLIRPMFTFEVEFLSNETDLAVTMQALADLLEGRKYWGDLTSKDFENLGVIA